MGRLTILAVALCTLALSAVAVGTVHFVNRERSSAASEFTAERRRAVEQVAREMNKDFENIGEVLAYAGQLFASSTRPEDRERELGALVTVVAQYKMVTVFDAQGAELLTVTDPAAGAGFHADAFREDLAGVARRALEQPPGEIEASPPFTVDGNSWYRVFATATAGASKPGAVALLVDTQPLFGKVRLIVTEPDGLLVLGAHGLPAPASTPSLAAAVDHTGPRDAFTQLVAQMRDGESAGTLLLDGAEAQRLGLGRAEVVAAYAPIPYRGGHWSVATLSSIAPVREHQQVIVVRLALAGGAIAFCLVALAAYIVFAARRQVALRERLRHAAHLAHLSEVTQKILDHVPAGVLSLSDEGTITRVNRALSAQLADPGAGGGVVGQPLAAAFPDAPAAVVERLRALVDAARASGQPRTLSGEPLALFGTEGTYRVHAVPLEDRFPEARALLVVEDLSQVQLLESQLLRAEKLATVGVLAAGIAHEIGTPLAVVRGRAEYTLGKLPADSPNARSLDVMIEQIDRVSRTIRQLLDFSRVRPATVRPASVAAAVHAVGELLRIEAERRKVALSLDVADELPDAAADPDQLQQVLINLVMNACDACHAEGGGRVVVTARACDVSAAAPWRALRIEVTDDGGGIPAELRHQVFDPFFTTKKRGEGTGLGLTVASQIVRNHGGEIELHDASPRGTRVTVLWPVASPAARPEARSAHA
jgi:signal transduction histidine kinase/PAS domain-containing protein